MRTRRIFWLFSLILALILFNAYPGLTGEEPKPEARGPEEVPLSNLGQGPPDLGLEQDHGGKDDLGPEPVNEPVEGVELQRPGRDQHEHDEPDADKHLEGPGPLDHQKEAVADIIHQRDVHGIVEPAVVGEGLAYFGGVVEHKFSKIKIKKKKKKENCK